LNTKKYFEVKAGNKHKVFIREDISSEEMIEISKKSSEYNIDFIKKQEDSYIVKVYETGVGFTLGAASSALAVFSCVYEEYGCSEVKLVFEGGIVKAVFKDNLINLTCFPYFVFSGEYNSSQSN
jgi:diaminopimelate epimerase